ncbi:lytic transglycosylase, partial [Cycloclasticus sp. 44_32_T64]
MHYLITNKTIKFLLFAGFSVLIACTPLQLRPPETTKFTTAIKPELTVSSIVDEQLKHTPADVPVVPANLWQRLFSLYKLPVIENKRVQAEINWYSKHPE